MTGAQQQRRYVVVSHCCSLAWKIQTKVFSFKGSEPPSGSDGRTKGTQGANSKERAWKAFGSYQVHRLQYNSCTWYFEVYIINTSSISSFKRINQAKQKRVDKTHGTPKTSERTRCPVSARHSLGRVPVPISE